jgi:hypothetical protein
MHEGARAPALSRVAIISVVALVGVFFYSAFAAKTSHYTNSAPPKAVVAGAAAKRAGCSGHVGTRRNGNE